jgi:alanine racemase
MLLPHFHNASATISLSALAENWRRLGVQAPGAEMAAAVKADAYGLGATEVTTALHRAGCRTFFIANANEGRAVRRGIDIGVSMAAPRKQQDSGPESRIYVLNGVRDGGQTDLLANGMRPVINSLEAIEQWRAYAVRSEKSVNCAIHIDTGMTRLGLLGSDVQRLRDTPNMLDGLAVDFWMTHLACADEVTHPLNREQLSLFRKRVDGLPKAPMSVANSAGIFLGPDWHLDLCRPGIALYGSNPEPNTGEPMREVVHVTAGILQIHEVGRDRTIGYGATHHVQPGTRIATCGVGYADGYLRSLSGKGFGMLSGFRVPLVGRVSMDLITFDVTSVPTQVLEHAKEISIIGGGVDIDELAASGGTIAYELLTGLGHRFARKYV